VQLVRELRSVDGGASAASARGIAALDHEVPDDPVEHHVVVVAPSREFGKVAAGVGRVFPVQLHGDFSHAAGHKCHK